MESGASWLGIVEVGLVFAIVFGWGFNELRQLRRDQRDDTRARSERAGPATRRQGGDPPPRDSGDADEGSA